MDDDETPASSRAMQIARPEYRSPYDEYLAPHVLPRPASMPVNFSNADIEEAEFRIKEPPLLGTKFQTSATNTKGRFFSVFIITLGALFATGGIIYVNLIESDMYISEFRYNVVDTSNNTGPITNGLASVLGSGGLGPQVNESYTVTDFLTSRQAVIEVEKKVDLRAIYTKKLAGRWDRLAEDASDDQLTNYWQRVVAAYFDPVTGLATAQVKAFNAADAQEVARVLLSTAERLVNDMQDRQRNDSIRFAKETLTRDNKDLSELRAELLRLRSQTGYIEPGTSGVAENVALATNVKMSIVTQQAELDALRSQSSKSPVIGVLSNRLAAARKQLADIEREIRTNGPTGTEALAVTVGKFDEMNQKVTTAASIVNSDLIVLQQAKSAAEAQHIYLATYVHPTLPGTPSYPNKVFMSVIVLAAALGFVGFAKLLHTVMRSHAHVGPSW